MEDKPYVFGDLTRSILTKFSATAATVNTKSKNNRTWKEFAGDSSGPDGYVFGRATKGAVNLLKDWWWSSSSPTEPNEELVEKTERKQRALQVVSDVKNRRNAKIEAVQNTFGEILRTIMTGDVLTAEHLENLWTVSRELSANQAASVIVAELDKVHGVGGDEATSTLITTNLHETEIIKHDFMLAIDSILRDNILTPDQVQLISSVSQRLPRDELVACLTGALMDNWQKKDAAKQLRQEKIAESMAKFRDLLRVVLSSSNDISTIPPDQVEMLWTVTGELTANQVAEVLLEQLQVIPTDSCSATAASASSSSSLSSSDSSSSSLSSLPSSLSSSLSSSSESSDPSDAIDVAKRYFISAVDSVLSSGEVSMTLLTVIRSVSRNIPHDVLATCLKERLTEHWQKKEDAKQAQKQEMTKLKALFLNSVQCLAKQSTIDKTYLDLVLSSSQLLSQATVNSVMSECGTTWADLWKKTTTASTSTGSLSSSSETEKLVSEAMLRPHHNPGWKPPPPPPRNKPPPPPPPPLPPATASSSTTASVSVSIATVTTIVATDDAIDASSASSSAASSSAASSSSASSSNISAETSNPRPRQSIVMPCNILQLISAGEFDLKPVTTATTTGTPGTVSGASTETAHVVASLSNQLKNALNAIRVRSRYDEDADDSDDDADWND